MSVSSLSANICVLSRNVSNINRLMRVKIFKFLKLFFIVSLMSVSYPLGVTKTIAAANCSTTAECLKLKNDLAKQEQSYKDKADQKSNEADNIQNALDGISNNISSTNSQIQNTLH